MHRTKSFGVAVILVIGLAVLGLRSVFSAEEPKAVPAHADFPSKIAVISFKSDPEIGVVLEKMQLKRLGDQSFLVGKGIDDGHPENWYKGQTVWAALSDVAYIVEYTDLEQLRKLAPKPAH